MGWVLKGSLRAAGGPRTGSEPGSGTARRTMKSGRASIAPRSEIGAPMGAVRAA